MKLNPLRELPARAGWKPGDVLVVFGEVFSRGYVNGLIDEARERGMKVVFATVGRRDEAGKLRPLNAEELKEREQPLINIPLEAGFDFEPSQDGTTPVDQLQGIKLSEWQSAKIDLTKVEESRVKGVEGFRQRVSRYLTELESHIPKGANVLFAHTMAGGVPRAKIVMPAMNRVFKGSGDRFASSEEFWSSDMGKLCDLSFMEVTAKTFEHLIELSQGLRQRIESGGGRAAYVAYGYHGTEVLMKDSYHWQSYSPYLQGFAKIELENIAGRALKTGVHASVYNAPEILTNSSSVFLGVEIALYPLLGALKKEGAKAPRVQKILKEGLEILKPEFNLESVMNYTTNYFKQPVIQEWSNFPAWPQHNGSEQMAAMREASTQLIEMHRDPKVLLTSQLSEVVFRSCGHLMLDQGWEPKQPAWWIGHDIVAKQTAQTQ